MNPQGVKSVDTINTVLDNEYPPQIARRRSTRTYKRKLGENEVRVLREGRTGTHHQRTHFRVGSTQNHPL